MKKPMTKAENVMMRGLLYALSKLDAGECDSGGDYHMSRVGRHCDGTGGKESCPACRVRAAIEEAQGLIGEFAPFHRPVPPGEGWL
jgi:hypothetical protein